MGNAVLKEEEKPNAEVAISIVCNYDTVLMGGTFTLKLATNKSTMVTTIKREFEYSVAMT